MYNINGAQPPTYTADLVAAGKADVYLMLLLDFIAASEAES